jgi:hypothetical protein
MSNEIPSNNSDRHLHIGVGAARLAIAAWTLPDNFYHTWFINDNIAITFWGRNGKETGKRGMPLERPAADGPNCFSDWLRGIHPQVDSSGGVDFTSRVHLRVSFGPPLD